MEVDPAEPQLFAQMPMGLFMNAENKPKTWACLPLKPSIPNFKREIPDLSKMGSLEAKNPKLQAGTSQILANLASE